VRPDPYRAHEGSTLHWLINQGFQSLATDFAPPMPGSTLDQSCTGPPPGRLLFDEARMVHQDFWSGRKTLREILDLHGNIVLVPPEKMDITPLLQYKLQRDLLDLHQGNLLASPGRGKDFRFGLLTYLPRLPTKKKVPDLSLGLQLAPNPFLEQPLWPFIDEIQVLRPSQTCQYSETWQHPTPLQDEKYHVLVLFTSENQNARELCMDANQGVYLDNQDNTGQIGWGFLRCNLDYLEHKMAIAPRTGKHYSKVLVRTWRMKIVPFPKCISAQAAGRTGATLDTHWKLVFDVNTTLHHKKEVDRDLRKAIQELRDLGWVLSTGQSRRSVGHHGSKESLESWDIAVVCDSVEDSAQCGSLLWDRLEKYTPLAAYQDMFNLDDSYEGVLLECSGNDVLFDLQERKVTCWTLLVGRGMAMVSRYVSLHSLEDLDKLVEDIEKYNRESSGRYLRDGARYVERIVLPETLFELPAIAQKMKANGCLDRVYWERNQGKYIGAREVAAARQSVNIQEKNHVLVHLGNWYVGTTQEIIKDIRGNIGDFLLQRLQAAGLVSPDEQKDAVLSWKGTGQINVLRLVTKSEEVARYLCRSVRTHEVKFPDSMGTMRYINPAHAMDAQDWKKHYDNLAVTLIPPEDKARQSDRESVRGRSGRPCCLQGKPARLQ